MYKRQRYTAQLPVDQGDIQGNADRYAKRMDADIHGAMDIPTHVRAQLYLLSGDLTVADEEDKEDSYGRGAQECGVMCQAVFRYYIEKKRKFCAVNPPNP